MGGDQNELNDTVLCYQAMGLPLDASPATIGRKYNALCEECKKKMASTDPVTQQEGRLSLDLLTEMYEKIRQSISYQAAERESQKRNEAPPKEAPAYVKPVHDAVAQRGLMTNCPHCNGSVVKGTLECPICHRSIMSIGEKIAAHLTVKRIILYLVVLAVLAVAALRLISSDSGQADVDMFEKAK